MGTKVAGNLFLFRSGIKQTQTQVSYFIFSQILNVWYLIGITYAYLPLFFLVILTFFPVIKSK